MLPARQRALERAQHYIGVKETRPNSGPHIDTWLHRAGVHYPAPWCGAFLYCVNQDSGLDAVTKIPYPAAVLSWVETANAHGWIVKRPLKGDEVAYSWHGHTPHPSDHIGKVEKVLALPRARRSGLSWMYWIRTVEGNTLDGRVARRWRWVDPNSVAFIRVPQ